MGKRQFGIITRFELRRLLVSAPGVLFMVFFACFYIWLAVKMAGWQEPLEEIRTGATALGLSHDSNPVLGMLGWLLDMKPSQLGALFEQHPPVLLILFAVTLLLTPFLVLILATDQTASDISRRHARYLVVRTDRRTLYLAKSLSVFIFWSLAAAFATITVGIVCISADLLGDASIGEVLAYLVRIFVTIVFFGLPFIALAGLAAALVGHAALAALVTFGSWGAITILGWALSLQFKQLDKLEYLFPTAMKYQLMSDDLGQVLLAAGHQLAFAVVALVVGMKVFQRRDV